MTGGLSGFQSEQKKDQSAKLSAKFHSVLKSFRSSEEKNDLKLSSFNTYGNVSHSSFRIMKVTWFSPFNLVSLSLQKCELPTVLDCNMHFKEATL